MSFVVIFPLFLMLVGSCTSIITITKRVNPNWMLFSSSLTSQECCVCVCTQRSWNNWGSRHVCTSFTASNHTACYMELCPPCIHPALDYVPALLPLPFCMRRHAIIMISFNPWACNKKKASFRSLSARMHNLCIKCCLASATEFRN